MPAYELAELQNALHPHGIAVELRPAEPGPFPHQAWKYKPEPWYRISGPDIAAGLVHSTEDRCWRLGPIRPDRGSRITSIHWTLQDAIQEIIATAQQSEQSPT